MLSTPDTWPSWTPPGHSLLTQTEELTDTEDASITPEDPYKQPGLHHLLQTQKFSCLSRLVNITAYVLRFVKNCKENKQVKKTGPLTPTERDEATRRLIQNAQQLTYSNIIVSLPSKAANTSTISTPSSSVQRQIQPSSLGWENTQRTPRRFNEVPNTLTTEK